MKLPFLTICPSVDGRDLVTVGTGNTIRFRWKLPKWLSRNRYLTV